MFKCLSGELKTCVKHNLYCTAEDLKESNIKRSFIEKLNQVYLIIFDLNLSLYLNKYGFL
jgi:hypothetical protein